MKHEKPGQEPKKNPRVSDRAPRQKGDPVLAKKLRDLRVARGWTQYDLAAMVGRHQSRIAKWETCQGVPEPRDMVAFAKAFNVPIVYLCDHQMLDPREAEGDKLSGDETLLIGVIRKIGTEKVLERLTSPGQEKPRDVPEARPQPLPQTKPPPPAKPLIGWRRKRRRPSF